MNTQKIKMALTAGLINQANGGATLHTIKNLMNNFAGEVGNFLGLTQLRNASLNPHATYETYALQYEKCTLNVELVSQPQSRVQTVQRFQLR